jgi:hypothetical protein
MTVGVDYFDGHNGDFPEDNVRSIWYSMAT